MYLQLVIKNNSLSTSSYNNSISSCFPAQEAINNLKESKSSQSIIITGESGAGKTETTKHLLNYLCGCYSDSEEIEHRLTANLLIEYFANAQTLANKNSSRFNRFIKVGIIFDNLYFILTKLSFSRLILMKMSKLLVEKYLITC